MNSFLGVTSIYLQILIAFNLIIFAVSMRKRRDLINSHKNLKDIESINTNKLLQGLKENQKESKRERYLGLY